MPSKREFAHRDTKRAASTITKRVCTCIYILPRRYPPALASPFVSFPLPAAAMPVSFPPLRLASSVQQLYVILEYIRVPFSFLSADQQPFLSDLLAPFVFIVISVYLFIYSIFVRMDISSTCLCCRCVIVPGTMAFHMLSITMNLPF